jgi:hypothetical protein
VKCEYKHGHARQQRSRLPCTTPNVAFSVRQCREHCKPEPSLHAPTHIPCQRRLAPMQTRLSSTHTHTHTHTHTTGALTSVVSMSSSLPPASWRYLTTSRCPPPLATWRHDKPPCTCTHDSHKTCGLPHAPAHPPTPCSLNASSRPTPYTHPTCHPQTYTHTHTHTSSSSYTTLLASTLATCMHARLHASLHLAPTLVVCYPVHLICMHICMHVFMLPIHVVASKLTCIHHAWQ